MTRCLWQPISIVLTWSLMLCNGTSATTVTGKEWAPQSRAALQPAIVECLKLSPTDCSKGVHGPIGSWDVSSVTDVSKLFLNLDDSPFPGANKFNGDISKWDMSKVT